jgi:hypothetical protein
MNQVYFFRPLISLIYRTSIRPFHLSSTRSIEWADIDEYTNKVNASVYLTTDVYEKDGKINKIFIYLM